MSDKKPGSPAKKPSPKKDKPAKKAPPAGGKVRKERPNKKPRNYALSTGVYRFSRSRMYHKKALYKFKGKKTNRTAKPKQPQFKTKEIGGEKNGGKREVRIQKLRNYYPVAEKKVRKNVRPAPQYFSKHKRTLRKSITPGTVLILVAGPHRGKRVIFLKQLTSGLLLVTGPFRLNACPLRRVNKIYVMATKTKVDISKVNIPGRINDEYFRRKREKRPKKGEGDIFAKKKEGYKVSDERKADQKKIDKKVMIAVKKHPNRKLLGKYLSCFFSLRSGQYPHRLVF